MSPGHIFAAACGFGLRLIPSQAPYRFRLGPVPPQIDSECRHAAGWRSARVIPDGDGYRTQLGPDTASLTEVLDIEPGPDWDAWWIETTKYRLPLPPSWTLHAAGTDQGPLFDLLGPGESDLFIQTPRAVPALAGLVGPGQRARRTGESPRSSWIELAYLEVDRAWIQRHEVLMLGDLPVVVTLQAPVEHLDDCYPVLASAVDRIRRTDAGESNPSARDAVG